MSNLDQLASHFRRAGMDTIPRAVVLLDAEGRIVYWNRSAPKLTGFASGEVLGSACEVTGDKVTTDQKAILAAVIAK